MQEIYCVELKGLLYQSVFPTHLQELSQLHLTVEDAKSYIKQEAGEVDVQVLCNLCRQPMGIQENRITYACFCNGGNYAQ